MIITYILLFVGIFSLTAILSRIFIPVLKSLKMGQKILDIGPRWHKSKEGTPTMGGITFIISSLVLGAIALTILKLLGFKINIWLIIINYLFALLNGLIGIIDDLAKLKKKQNQGLKAWQKYLLQFILSIAYIVVLIRLGYASTEVYIPFFKKTFDFGFVYYPFMVLLITGIVNSVNLTDGIDGLASSVTLIVSVFFIIASVILSNEESTFLAIILLGCTSGFLVYNFHPAKIFMGDTGSLFIGGMVIGLAFMINNPIIIIFVGIVYICEALSDIIQVSYFKLSHGKRIFKMAPIHHHFEKCGWGEIKIVVVFSLVTLAFCIISIFGL